MGWMNRLTVSITMSAGMNRIGVPWGRKCAKDLVLCEKPKSTVPAHSGITITRLIGNYFVGVKEWARSSRRLVNPINKLREININDQTYPLILCIVIICFRISLIVHCWVVIRQLLIRWLEEGNMMLGNTIIIIMIDIPVNVV